MLGFKLFPLERRTEDDLPQHVKGAAHWHEENDEEGYWVFNLLSQKYRAIEYNEDTRQWYFVGQDTHTGRWVASGPVPSSYNPRRHSIRPISNVSTILVDDQTAGHTRSSLSKTGDLYSLAIMSGTSTLTQTATALDLAGKGKAKDTGGTFFRMQAGGGPPAGGSGGGGSGGGGPGGLGGPGGPGGGGSGTGGGGGRGGGAGGAPHTGGKLGENPPVKFDNDHSKADTFMNEFNLYCLTNFDSEQVVNPLKRTTLLLGFIKGPNVKDWVKR